MTRVPVIVAAAGGSTRCPEGKLLKLWQGRPLLEWLLETLSHHPGVGEILVVSGRDREGVEQLATRYASARVVHNPDWAEGLSTSLRVGEQHIAQGSGLLVALGDTPLFASKTLSLILPPDPSSDEVRVPTHEGRRGHPVFVPAWLREHWHRLQGDQGARPLFGQWPDRVLEIPVQDEGILRDFDHAADFEASPR